jgi:hypothetical protein
LGRGLGPQCGPALCARGYFFSELDLNPEISLKLLQIIETCSFVQKLQGKFHWNPLEQPYTVDSTKVVFVYYCPVENSNKSNLGVFLYKNP